MRCACLRYCYVVPQQLVQLVQSTRGCLLAREHECLAMHPSMRRPGHALEHSPNNVEQLLRGNRSAVPGEYCRENHYTYVQLADDSARG